MSSMREITSGLRFPEGPIAMPDGSVILVEIERGTLTRVQPDGSKEVIAETGGGPNGAALGPDGAVYVCNNGGFEWHRPQGLLIPGDQPEDYSGGRIERVDPETGQVEELYRECHGNPLRGPNDIVFDRHGGFWFTDHGKMRRRDRDRGGVYYALPDGSEIREVILPLDAPNGIGLSADESTLYVSETLTGRIWSFAVSAPGEITPSGGLLGKGELVHGLPGMQLLDSLAMDAEDNICVATIISGGITSVSPDGGDVRFFETGDPMTTNICFGGEDLRTAYITLSATGRLVAVDWSTPGLPLNFLNR